MSTPILICDKWKAAKGDLVQIQQYKEDMLYNTWANLGMYSIFDCRCSPKCEEASEDQIKQFDAATKEYINLARKKVNEERAAAKIVYEQNKKDGKYIKIDRWIEDMEKKFFKDHGKTWQQVIQEVIDKA